MTDYMRYVAIVRFDNCRCHTFVAFRAIRNIKTCSGFLCNNLENTILEKVTLERIEIEWEDI